MVEPGAATDRVEELADAVRILLDAADVEDVAVAYDGTGSLEIRTSADSDDVDAAIIGRYLLQWRPVARLEPVTDGRCPAPPSATRQCDLDAENEYLLQSAPFELSGVTVEATTTSAGQPGTILHFDAATARRIATWSGDHVGEQVALSDGREVITAPIIQAGIRGSSLQISGNSTVAQSDRVQALLALAAGHVELRRA